MNIIISIIFTAFIFLVALYFKVCKVVDDFNVDEMVADFEKSTEAYKKVIENDNEIIANYKKIEEAYKRIIISDNIQFDIYEKMIAEYKEKLEEKL